MPGTLLTTDIHVRQLYVDGDQYKNTDVTDKCLASFDVKSLFTNVSVDCALEAIKSVVANIDLDLLPLPKDDYLKLIAMCLNFGGFQFDSDEYRQDSGLAMGLSLSLVAACLYMEWLEKHHFQDISWATAFFVFVILMIS